MRGEESLLGEERVRLISSVQGSRLQGKACGGKGDLGEEKEPGQGRR
jgi:hypothetical protein